MSMYGHDDCKINYLYFPGKNYYIHTYIGEMREEITLHRDTLKLSNSY